MSLDRDTVLRAALTMLDDEPLQAFSMRRLAEHLGVTPMALYNHVRSRDDLVDGVTDLVASGIALPPHRWGWRRRLRTVLLALRAVCIEHPAAATLLQQTRALTPALLAPMEIALGALEEAGLRPLAARTAWTALIGLTYGHVAYELAGHMRGATPGAGEVDRAAFPHVAAMATGPALDWDRAFAQALDAVIEGFTAGAAR
jgi:TetR/AcrR family tetracycline transcriptional repressor